jgi:hypothetical protein
MILDCLPSDSAAIFSICCMQIKRHVGDQYLAHLSEEDTMAVMGLLAQDLPDQVACSICRKLHSMANAERYIPALRFTCRSKFKWVPCVKASFKETHTDHPISRYFSATLFQMAMKRYHQDPENTQLLKLMSSATKITPFPDLREQSRTYFRIIEGSMMNRSQFAYISARPSSIGFNKFWIPFRKICPHLNIVINEADVYIESSWNLCRTCHPKVVWSLNAHLITVDGKINTSTDLQSCSYCRTEFRIDFKHYQSCGIAIICTWWKDFGDRLEGDDFKRHFNIHDNLRHPRPHPSPVRYEPGDISSTFETGAESKWDSILTEGNMRTFKRALRAY